MTLSAREIIAAKARITELEDDKAILSSCVKGQAERIDALEKERDLLKELLALHGAAPVCLSPAAKKALASLED